MIITDIYIKNFGMLSEKRMHFSEGLQVLCGENESGKSTLYAFIRAMLFGMERGRGKAAAKDDFTRYEPWENPGYYAGVLRFCCGGKKFRLERDFSRYTKRTLLVCEDDGEELSVEDGDLDMLLGGVTPALYDSTVSIGQLAAAPGQELSAALENYAANLCESGGGDLDVNGALKCLKDRRRETEKKLRAEEDSEEEKHRRILQERTYLERDIKNLADEIEEKNRRLAAGQAPGGPDEKLEAGEAWHYNLPAAMLFAAAVLCFVFGFFFRTVAANEWSSAEAGSVVFVFTALMLAGAGLLFAGEYVYIKDRRRMRIRELEAAREEEDVRIRHILWEKERAQAEMKEKEIRLVNLEDQCPEIEENREKSRLEARLRALRTAEEQLKLAAEELGRQTAESLNEKASDIFAQITDGRYSGLKIGEKLQVSVWDGSRNIPAERLSRGTLEQIYFSVRMAAAEILQEEPLPVILDETFAFYDEKRLESALKWLRGQKKQVIILSCGKREEEIARRL